MDDMKRALDNLQTKLAILEDKQDAMTVQARVLESRSKDVREAISEVRSAFAGVAATELALWGQVNAMNERLKALEAWRQAQAS